MQKSRLCFALDEDFTPNNDLEWDHPRCNESSEARNFDPSLFSEGILHSLHEIARADARKYAPLSYSDSCKSTIAEAHVESCFTQLERTNH